MFRCWGCGNDFPDIPYASKAEATMWEEQMVGYALIAAQRRVDNYRRELIESYKYDGTTDEHQQGILDGLLIALDLITGA